jgi:predicted permease
LLLGSWVLGVLKVMLPSGASRVSEASLNGWVLGFAVAAGLVTSLLSGLVPAFHAARQDVREALAQASRSAGSSRANRWRAALIAGEFALTSVLLVGASLMLRTLDNLHRVDLGFTTEHLVTFNWVVKGGGYDSGATRNRLFDRAIEHLAAVPGVTRVGLADTLPLEGDGSDTVYCVKGSPSPKEGEEPSTGYNSISGEYFATLGMKLLAGRTFDVRDSARAPAVVIVDTMFVEREFHGQNPLGQRFFTGNRPPQNESAWFEIVGVVSHINRLGPGQSSRPQVYFTTAQWTPNSVNFVVRTDRDPVTITPSLRAAMREVAGDLPILSVRTMDQLLASGISAQRFIGTLLGAFAALALLLAGVGLFGGLSYNVGQRTHEIGVRAALGATPGSILGLVLRSGLKLAGVGLALGLLAALGLTRFLQSVLYEVSPFDPVSFAAVSLVLAGIGAFACWLPARRATKVDPIIALRAE